MVLFPQAYTSFSEESRTATTDSSRPSPQQYHQSYTESVSLTVRQGQAVTVSTRDIDDLGDAEVLYEPGPQGRRLRGAAS